MIPPIISAPNNAKHNAKIIPVIAAITDFIIYIY